MISCDDFYRFIRKYLYGKPVVLAHITASRYIGMQLIAYPVIYIYVEREDEYLKSVHEGEFCFNQIVVPNLDDIEYNIIESGYIRCSSERQMLLNMARYIKEKDEEFWWIGYIFYDTLSYYYGKYETLDNLNSPDDLKNIFDDTLNEIKVEAELINNFYDI